MSFPPHLEIQPLVHPPRVAVGVPGSKSITNRALVLAALAGRGRGCKLRRALQSEDTEVMMQALRELGFHVAVEQEWPDYSVLVGGTGADIIPAAEANLYVANSGTSMRFLTALVALGRGRYRLDGVARMRERPIEDLLGALRQLGVNAFSEAGNGCPPVVVESNGLNGGRVRLKGDVSSQFLSGLLMAAPLARNDVVIEVEGELVSQPYVAMTTALMEQFGVQAACDKGRRFHIPGRQQYRPPHQSQNADHPWFIIEPDASAASYFFAAAAVTGGQVTVLGIPEPSLQGDVRFVEVLAEMGCRVERCGAGVTVHGRTLQGVDVDMNDISDTVMTLGAVACFAKGPTTMRNVGHIRHKETDRLAALATELRRVGAEVDEFADGLRITPRPLHGATIETYHDHRMAMSLALVGLRVPGVIIQNPGCVVKTYPGYFEDLEKLRQ